MASTDCTWNMDITSNELKKEVTETKKEFYTLGLSVVFDGGLCKKPKAVEQITPMKPPNWLIVTLIQDGRKTTLNESGFKY